MRLAEGVFESFGLRVNASKLITPGSELFFWVSALTPGLAPSSYLMSDVMNCLRLFSRS
jgi:hypothetical protein